MEKRKVGGRSKSLLTISTVAHDFMTLLPGRDINEIQKLMLQTAQCQNDTIKSLLEADCIERISRGKYKLTKFGKHLMPILKIRRER